MTSQRRYDGPRTLDTALSRFSLATLETVPFGRETPDAGVERRDLGIAEATGGQVHMIHSRSVKPFDRETGWHWHDMDAHIVYVIRGWVSFRYQGMEDEVVVHAGACISQPGGVPHNVVGRSDDLEAIEINLPLDHGTYQISDSRPPAT
jgi:uncharacterized RmlC-like cupin family protein